MLKLSDKHAVKQVDRLLSNKKLILENIDQNWIKFVIGSRKEIKVTMDWTNFDPDKQATIHLNLVTSHGRATPLLWKTVYKDTLKGNENSYENQILLRFKSAIPKDVKVTILADRGFFDIKLFDYLKKELKFDYSIRIKNNTYITDNIGNTKKATDWVPKNGKIKTIRGAKITADKYEVSLVAIKHQKGMKEPWCIVSSAENQSGTGLISWYAKRWGCETYFKDTKDIHFGMGLHATHIKNVERRDRILLISAIATVMLTLLGAACEKIGFDKYLKVNTSK
jgi:Transposase DDE domain